MDTEQEVENHSAPVSDYADPLYGIRGWLLVYLIGPIGLNCPSSNKWNRR